MADDTEIEEQEEQEEQEIQEEERGNYLHEIKKKLKNGKWRRVAEITVKPRDHIENIIEESTWGGPGIYRCYMKNPETLEYLDEPPYVVTIDDEETENEKTKQHPMDSMIETLQKETEFQSALNTKIKLEEASKFRQPEIKKEDIQKTVEETVQKSVKETTSSILENQKESMSDNLKFMLFLQQQQSNKGDSTAAILVESMKSMQQQNTAMMESMRQQNQNNLALLVEAMKPKESNLEKVITGILDSPFIKDVFSLLRPKETTWEKIIPILMEKTTASVVNQMDTTMKLIADSKNNPPVDYDKQTQSKIHFIKEIASVGVNAVKEISEIFSMKLDLTPPPQPAPQQPQPASQQPQPAPQQPPPAPQQPQPEDDQNKVVQKEFLIALDIIEKNYDKNLDEIIPLLQQQTPLIVYILKKNEKQEVLKHINVPEKVKDRISELIDMIKKETNHV